MDANTFILGFSLVIFFAGIIMFLLMSKEFTKMSEGQFKGGPEGGPRAAVFDKLYEFFSAPDEETSPESLKKTKAEIRKLLEEMD